ncbi:MAG: ribosomal-protein-alanine N-acetyltransferase [Glaciecola sp.]|jgi:ribosomal-protein-alanine N-acetyltransferase
MEFKTDRLRLWLPEANQAKRMIDYYLRNRGHLKRWEPLRTDHFYTEEYWAAQLAQNQVDASNRVAYRMGIELREGDDDRPVIGVVNISNVIRGSFQAAHVGYSIDALHTRQGLMTEALNGVVEFAFAELDLHRLMANYIPSNAASARTLAKAGFEKEGFAKRYLLINDVWEDHVLTSRIKA